MICKTDMFALVLWHVVVSVTVAFSFTRTRVIETPFGVATSRVVLRQGTAKSIHYSYRQSLVLFAQKEEKDETGMEEAFRELEAMDSLDGIDDSPLDIEYKSTKDLEQILDKEELKAPKVAPEDEIKRYTELYKDLKGDEEGEELYNQVLQDLGGTVKSSSSSSKKEEKEDADAPQLSTSTTGERSNMEDFMNAALEEAVKEAQDKTPEELASLSDNILDDKEMMDEIRGVFDKANEELLQGLDEIRKEQTHLAKASAEQTSKERIQTEKDNEVRMAQAQAKMERVLETVSKETLEVEKAVQDLKRAQEAMDDDPVMQLVGGDLVKQAALAGALLFSARAVAETVAMVSDGGGGHAMPALIQGAIGLGCGAYFLLQK